ncbi:MAG: arginine--tRNA ligase [Desulfovibrio sp.]|nr:arginine--tRNA ligase [Desulfovibrio sp.]
MRAIEDVKGLLHDIVQSLGYVWPDKCVVEQPKDPSHGDLATNLAMLLAKQAKKNPKLLAEEIAKKLSTSSFPIERVSIAGPGFCNIVLPQSYWQRAVSEVERLGGDYGKTEYGQGKRVLVEFVSANPTGPLHIGHGRGAAYGDSLAKLLRFAGYTVSTEYYVNDAGRQMRLLGLSVFLRAKELQGIEVAWPEEWYRGSYIIDLARALLAQVPDLCLLPEAEAIDRCYQYAMQQIMDGIQKDLADFGVHHDTYFSEKSLVQSHAVDQAFAALDAAGKTYVQDNAYWFATSQAGDDRDRVLRKSDGSLTYFASDIAYHHNKYERGFDWLIDVWGADHHGYIPRMRAAIASMGKEQSTFDVVLIQLVNLLREGKPLSMSTRAGTFETLRDCIDEVGTDACRFMFLSRKSDSPLDFDLDLVRKRNLENPVYYAQYAYARCQALLRKANEAGLVLDATTPIEVLEALSDEDDLLLLRKAAAFEDVVVDAARTLGVHHISRYVSELAGLVHSFYAKHKIVGTDNAKQSHARLALFRAIGVILANALGILGVSAPESM